MHSKHIGPTRESAKRLVEPDAAMFATAALDVVHP
jgi:hypothetical protein